MCEGVCLSAFWPVGRAAVCQKQQSDGYSYDEELKWGFDTRHLDMPMFGEDFCSFLQQRQRGRLQCYNDAQATGLLACWLLLRVLLLFGASAMTGALVGWLVGLPGPPPPSSPFPLPTAGCLTYSTAVF